MRILFVVNNIWPPPVFVTGISVIYACIKQLAKTGYDVHILTSIGLWDKYAQKSRIDTLYDVRKWQQEEEKRYGVHFHTYSLPFLSAFPKLAFIVNRFIPILIVPIVHRKYSFDAIHEYTSTPALLYRSIILKRLCPSARIFHTIIAQIPNRTGSAGWISHFPPKIDCVICSSRFIADSMVAAGYAKSLIKVLSLGVDDQRFKAKHSRLTLRRKYGLKNRALIVLFIGPIEPHKGADIFAKAAVGLGKLENVIFICATYDSPGHIPYADRRREIERITMPLGNRFIIREGIHNVPELMALSDAVVVPQTTVDGATAHPVTLLEAMAAGCIVVASDLAGTEVIQHGINGFIFANKNIHQLVRLLRSIAENSTVRTKIGSTAIQTIRKEYAISVIAKKLSAFYRSSP